MLVNNIKWPQTSSLRQSQCGKCRKKYSYAWGLVLRRLTVEHMADVLLLVALRKKWVDAKSGLTTRSYIVCCAPERLRYSFNSISLLWEGLVESKEHGR